MCATALVCCRQPQWNSAWLSSSGNSCSTHAKHSNLQLMSATCGLAIQAVAGTQQVMAIIALIMVMNADLKQQQQQPSSVGQLGTANGAGAGAGSSTLGGLALVRGPKLMPGVFQERWKALPAAANYTEALNMATVAAMGINNHKDFTGHLAGAGIATMASGGAPPQYRWVMVEGVSV